MSEQRKRKKQEDASAATGILSMEFGQQEERQFFTEHFQDFFRLLPDLGKALDNIFKHSVPANRAGLIIFMLGKLCVDDFNEIFLLCANGFGFGAMKILRGTFEKLVDARYLHLHPEEIDKFWDYHVIKLQKLQLDDIMKKTNPEWQKIIAGFKTVKRKNGAFRLQQNWTQKDLVARAEEVGFKEQIRNAYYLPNEFVRTSISQILFNIRQEADDTLTTLDYAKEQNRTMAGIALHMSYFFLLEIMKVEIEHYDYEHAVPLAQRCADEFTAYLHSMKR